MAGKAKASAGPSAFAGLRGARVLIIEARFYDKIGDELLNGAIAELDAAGVSYEVVTVPGALEIPLALSQQIDVTWLLLLTLVAMELSLLTPPFGLLLFVMKGVAPPNVTLMDVYAAALPFVVMKLLILALLIAWPEFGLWLPRKVL